ncbi:MAG: cell filamentation protein Fic [Bacteroidetes bacterium]|jgi:Fic family protein|nr:cell filamentation protein Fic [Bacteroidota bacterium]
MSAYFSTPAPNFHDLALPEQIKVVGYAAIIYKLALKVPIPDHIAVIESKRKQTVHGRYKVLHFPKTYDPERNEPPSELVALYQHLVFALKYEGVDLLVFSMLCKHYTTRQLSEITNIAPTGQYSRRLWFLFEWVLGELLPNTPDLSSSKKRYVDVLDTTLQFGIKGKKSERHRVLNNLPGTSSFCPLVKRTATLNSFIKADLSKQTAHYLEGIKTDMVLRASAYLMLKDSKASFNIEGENPKNRRAILWGNTIGQAGRSPLSHSMLEKLQRMVIENPRFVKFGYRKRGGFVGEHDRLSGTPIPEHISAKPSDLEELMDGLVKTAKQLTESDIDAVVAAAVVAFGFVFIHPFEDGNGRIHRYLAHHVLARMQFSKQGVVFPISAAILEDIQSYRTVLQSYSSPRLRFMEWRETTDHNVDVTNDTFDYYRFFDATPQAEFLYRCVETTITQIIPKEIAYLRKYEGFKSFINQYFEMPDRLVSLLLRFLEQNDGKLSKRAREKEFAPLTDQEAQLIEATFRDIFTKEEE